MPIVTVIYIAALVAALWNAILTPRVRWVDKFTWVMFILFLPFLGIVGWFLFGADRSEPDELDHYDAEPASLDDEDDVIEGELQ